jgi:hypothetical protein
MAARETLAVATRPVHTLRMTSVALGVAAVGAAVVVTLVGLTGAGSRRRGAPIPVSTIAGLFFPVTWVAWYVRDELVRPELDDFAAIDRRTQRIGAHRRAG